jgi:hypothetical protein
MIEGCIIVVGLAAVVAMCIVVGLELARWQGGKR